MEDVKHLSSTSAVFETAFALSCPDCWSGREVGRHKITVTKENGEEQELRDNFWQLSALHWHETLMTSLLTNFLLSGTDVPAVSVQEGSLNAKIIQQALPTLFFLSYLVVKV